MKDKKFVVVKGRKPKRCIRCNRIVRFKKYSKVCGYCLEHPRSKKWE